MNVSTYRYADSLCLAYYKLGDQYVVLIIEQWRKNFHILSWDEKINFPNELYSLPTLLQRVGITAVGLYVA